jgi:endonuclease III
MSDKKVLGLRHNDPLSKAVEFNTSQGQSQDFADDEPILGVDQLNLTLDRAESKYTSLLVGTIANQVDRWWKTITPALDKLDLKKIDQHPLDTRSGIQGVLLGGWQEIFSTGSQDGIAEINEISLQEKEASPKGLFNYERNVLSAEFSRRRRRNDPDRTSMEQLVLVGDRHDDWIEFANRDRSGIDKFLKGKPAFEVAYPPDQADLDVLSVEELREALNARTQLLATDLSDEVSDRIARVIKDSVDIHYVEGNQVQRLPKAARTKIRNRINGIISYERTQQIAQGVAPEDLPRTKLKVPGRSETTLVSRAKMIASTELNAGYNLGRLQSYARAGVTSVRWQAIGDLRTCKICLSRRGLVLPLETVLRAGIAQSGSKSRSNKYSKWEYVIPAHPFCRCAWQVATRSETKDQARAAVASSVAPLAKTWGLIDSAVKLTSAVGIATTAVGTAAAITRERQLQTKAKNRAKNRTALAVGGVLSLGVLTLGLWNWLNRLKSQPQAATSKPVQVAKAVEAIASEAAQEQQIKSVLTKTQGDLAQARQKRELDLLNSPLTPAILLRGSNIAKLNANSKFLNSGIDLKTVSDTQLRIDFGFLPTEIAQIRGLVRKYQAAIVKTSPFERLMPAAVISPFTLSKYPWMADITDIRDLNIRQMLKKDIPEPEALLIYNQIYRRARAAAGIAQVSREDRNLLRRINAITTKEQLAGLLQLTRNQDKIVNSLFAKLQRYQAQGKKFTSIAELRLRGIGDQTIARLLAQSKGKLRINEILMSSDRTLALEKLQTIAGVGTKTAKVIYNTLLTTGTQFLDADDMIRRIEPLMKAQGLELTARIKKAFSSRLDFTYYPGLDRQTLPPAEDFPTLPGFEPRGDAPQGQTPGSSPSNNSSRPLVNSPSPRLASGNDQSPTAASSQADHSKLTQEAIAYGQNFKKSLAGEIRQAKTTPLSRQSLGDKLIETEKRVTSLIQRQEAIDKQAIYNKADKLLQTIDQNVVDLTSDLENTLVDPLVESGYSSKGRLSFGYRNRLNQKIKQLESMIVQVDKNKGLSLNSRSQIKRLKNELNTLKRSAIAWEKRILDNPASLSNLEREKALLRIDDSIDQLSATQGDTSAFESIKKELQVSSNNPVVDQINQLAKTIKDLEATPVDPKSLVIQQQLRLRKERLQQLRDRNLTAQQQQSLVITNQKRQEFGRISSKLKQKTKEFDQQFTELEQSFLGQQQLASRQISLNNPDNIAYTKRLSIDLAQSKIEENTRIILNAQREIDLLKSDRWQQYATSVANLEDLATGESLGNNYLPLEELVSRRNDKLNQAAGSIKRSAKDIVSWTKQPENILAKQLNEVEQTLVKLNQLKTKQVKLAKLGSEIQTGLSSNPGLSALVESTSGLSQRSLRYQQQIDAAIAQLELGQDNLRKAIADGYKFNGNQDSVARIQSLAGKSIKRAEARLLTKDRASVTAVLDLIDKAGLQVSQVVESAKSGNYSPLESKVIESLSVKEKKVFESAIAKGVLELNQDIRVLESSRSLLNSVARKLQDEQTGLISSLGKNVSILTGTKARLLSKLQLALENKNFASAEKTAQNFSTQEAKILLRKIARIKEIEGDRSAPVTIEVNILAGVRPQEIPREQFINLTKANASLVNEKLYNLREIEQAINLNITGIQAAEARLNAANF